MPRLRKRKRRYNKKARPSPKPLRKKSKNTNKTIRNSWLSSCSKTKGKRNNSKKERQRSNQTKLQSLYWKRGLS